MPAVQLVTKGAPPLRVIAVAGGKGGVGKTHISVNLSVLLAKRGRRVLLVDGDVSLANADMMLGVSPRLGFDDVVAGRCRIEDALTATQYGVTLLAGAHGEIGTSHLGDMQKLALLGALDSVGDAFDSVVIDTPAGLGGNALFFASAAQEVIVVTTPEPTALADTYATVRSLAVGSGRKSIGLVVNQAMNERLALEVHRRLRTLVRRFLSIELELIGWIPYDGQVHEAVMHRTPFVSHAPACRASRNLMKIVDRVAGGSFGTDAHADAVRSGVQFFWRQLLSMDRPEGAQMADLGAPVSDEAAPNPESR